MKLIKQFSKIETFKPKANNLYINGVNQNFLLEDKFEIIYSINEAIDYQVQNISEDFIILFNTSSFGYLKIYKSNILIFEKEKVSYRFNRNNFFILINEEDESSILFNIQNQEILGKSNKEFGFIKYGNEQYFFTTFINDKYKLFCFDFNDLSEQWQYQIPTQPYSQGEYGMVTPEGIRNIIGEYKGVLWIVTNLGHLIGLNIATGTELYHLTTPNNKPSEWGDWQIFVPATKSAIDYENGILFGIDDKIYWECNLNYPLDSYMYYDITATCDANKIVANLVSYYPIWSGDEIFFAQQGFSIQPSYVGVFNRKSKEITWTSHELGEQGVFKGLRKIDYAAGRLYVLDGEGTLHIFER